MRQQCSFLATGTNMEDVAGCRFVGNGAQRRAESSHEGSPLGWWVIHNEIHSEEHIREERLCDALVFFSRPVGQHRRLMDVDRKSGDGLPQDR